VSPLIPEKWQPWLALAIAVGLLAEIAWLWWAR